MGKDNCHSTNRHLKAWVGAWQGWKQLSLFCAVDSFLKAIMQVMLLLRRVRTHALTAQELALQNCTGWGSQKASRGAPGHWLTSHNGKNKRKKIQKAEAAQLWLETSKRWVTIATKFWEKTILRNLECQWKPPWIFVSKRENSKAAETMSLHEKNGRSYKGHRFKLSQVAGHCIMSTSSGKAHRNSYHAPAFPSIFSCS